MNRRVVITGMGVCTPVGIGLEQAWHNLLAGRSGIAPITLFEADCFPVRIGGEVKGLDKRRLAEEFPALAGEGDRKLWLGLDAASQAIGDSGLSATAFENAPLFVGVSLEAFHLPHLASPAPSAGLVRSLISPSPSTTGANRLQTPLDRLAQLLGGKFGLLGGRYTNCSACAAGAQVIGEAFRRLRDGSADLALAGATDSVLNPLGLGGFSLLHILSEENDRPAQACRPFDATRQGTVLSEGAAFVVMETSERAMRRGARIHAEVLGYGSSLDAYRVTDPQPTGRGAALSMEKAISDAGLAPAGIDGINAHGTGTPKNDLAETLAIKQILGRRAYEIPVTANKSMTGHMIAASGAAEAVFSAMTLKARRVPPTINLQQADPQCDLDYVKEGAREFPGRTVLSNSFGFGGQNATLVFGLWEP